MGFIITGAVLAYQVTSAVREYARGEMHGRAAVRHSTSAAISAVVNAGFCGIAFIPVAGLPIAIIGGLIWNLGDAFGQWSQHAAKALVPTTQEEIMFMRGKVLE